jgi:hypothetical protein
MIKTNLLKLLFSHTLCQLAILIVNDKLLIFIIYKGLPYISATTPFLFSKSLPTTIIEMSFAGLGYTLTWLRLRLRSVMILPQENLPSFSVCEVK